MKGAELLKVCPKFPEDPNDAQRKAVHESLHENVGSRSFFCVPQLI